MVTTWALRVHAMLIKVFWDTVIYLMINENNNLSYRQDSLRFNSLIQNYDKKEQSKIEIK